MNICWFKHTKTVANNVVVVSSLISLVVDQNVSLRAVFHCQVQSAHYRLITQLVCNGFWHSHECTE